MLRDAKEIDPKVNPNAITTLVILIKGLYFVFLLYFPSRSLAFFAVKSFREESWSQNGNS